ncbi:MAG: hypothetical protein KJ645_12335 [Planctomycetes bacterium]|nr:hypothetical protein [Planctomycetota bacterium]
MSREKKLDRISKQQQGIGFELYYFITVSFFFVALLYLVPIVDALQKEHSTPLQQMYAGALVIISPALLYFLSLRIFKEILPGRIVLAGILVCVAYLMIFPDERTRWREFKKHGILSIVPLVWPLLVFSFIFLVFQWERVKRIKLIRARLIARAEGKGLKAFPREKGEAERDLEKVRASFGEGLKAKKILEGNVPPVLVGERQPNPRKSKPMSGLHIYLGLLIILGMNFGFIWISQVMSASKSPKTQFSAYFLFMLYPPLLYGMLTLLVRRGPKAGFIFFGCLLSWMALWVFMPNPTNVHLLSIPTACFAIGFFLSERSIPLRMCYGRRAKKIPKLFDDSLEQRLNRERQHERKFRSKVDNTRYYGNSYYNTRRK